ncbi:hypothetical protein EET67_24375 [Pseudaminobacter arsenicus]|uniref:Formylmethanofuran dehydrogenase subunit E domain-containing protein n=1 Tax=Borborobacter arsenicus TaxID=1851146 RepID=A0A432UZ82_9HYPH|nr:hypothetical protein [Pseudaminobacter arsenicus]RUM95247.1 hypothetical protein EET67_24375 [Pseudaminobacter arsenicus]
MDFPDFFSRVPTITLHDPLAVFLGASKTGVMNYCYADAVKLAGHSCPTVAGAYLMVRRGLQHLYGNDMPTRGGVEVYLRDPRDQGTTGVIAAVATLITGAAPETGFGGIGVHRRFGRRGLLHFDAPIDELMALRRRDNGRGVILDLDTSVVPAAREMQVLLPRAVAEQANEDELDRFAALWQARVEQMVIRHADDPALVHVAEWRAAA